MIKNKTNTALFLSPEQTTKLEKNHLGESVILISKLLTVSKVNGIDGYIVKMKLDSLELSFLKLVS